eukprot:scaffold8861_cov23-Cyclotella_meneghiniana.AAC.1
MNFLHDGNTSQLLHLLTSANTLHLGSAVTSAPQSPQQSPQESSTNKHGVKRWIALIVLSRFRLRTVANGKIPDLDGEIRDVGEKKSRGGFQSVLDDLWRDEKRQNSAA